MTDGYSVSVANLKGRIPLGTRTRRQEDDIKMDRRRFGYGGYVLDSAGFELFHAYGWTDRPSEQMGSPQGCGKTFELKGRGGRRPHCKDQSVNVLK
jgi:hypothetical protein